MSYKAHILIISEKERLEYYDKELKPTYRLHSVTSIKEAWSSLYEYPVRIILFDQKTTKNIGIDFLRQIKSRYPEIIKIIIFHSIEIKNLISSVNEAGIYQCLFSPCHLDNLKIVLHNAAQIYKLQENKKLLPLNFNAILSEDQTEVKKEKNTGNNTKQVTQKNKKYAFDQLVRSKDSPLNGLCGQVKNISQYDIPVLIYGESGTGKELMARAIHYYSSREDKPLIAENCAALPDDLLESELFGHVKGAFTGAYGNKQGLLEQANGGTVFLDEVGDISLSFQAKLLRVLQEKVIRPLGGNRYIPINIRIVSATNKDLNKEIKKGNFREDLFYRLAGAEFKLPPLRERQSDIPLLCESIISEFNLLLNKKIKTVEDDAIKILKEHQWRGNIRELQNEIQYAMITTKTNVISTKDLSDRLKKGEQ
mgnify:CR=1 FL=1